MPHNATAALQMLVETNLTMLLVLNMVAPTMLMPIWWHTVQERLARESSQTSHSAPDWSV